MSPPTLQLIDGHVDRATMHKHAVAYVAARRARHEITVDTARRLATILGGFTDSYGRRDPAKLGRADVERWQATRSHVAPGTRRLEYSAVRQFIRYLLRRRIIRHDPTADMPTPRVPRSVPRALTHDEAAALAGALPDARARAVFALMRRCGLRRGEVVGLEVGDWDRHGETLRVCGKGGHERLVPVPSDVAPVLSGYLAEHGAAAGPMIRTVDGCRGISHSYLGRLMSGWMVDAGVKTGAGDGRACHSLRHTAASELADVEPDLRVVGELLGHQHLSSTAVYVRRVGLGRVRSAMEASAPEAA